MILACHNLNKAFGEHTIVCDGSFHIEDREKAALVGINGAGKSTILKMIIGEEPLDGGDVILAKGKTLGYLAQRQDLTSGNTIYEEVKSAKADIFCNGSPASFHRAGTEILNRGRSEKPAGYIQPASV